jgi:hypothetical protein
MTATGDKGYPAIEHLGYRDYLEATAGQSK